MANGQQIVENHRVSALFKAVMSVVSTLIIAGIMAIFTVSWMLNNSIQELNTQVALLIQSNQHRDDEHSKFERRISEIERQWSRQRDDSRE